MLRPAIPITSEGDIEDIDRHFRVAAGPGAGKTHWLVSHVRRVVRESNRLTPCSQVLCLSYTNIAVSELTSRLGSCGERVEVSTIHAFLYKYVLKPYAHLLVDDSGQPLVNHAAIDGHEEHRPAHDKVKNWLESIGSKQATKAHLLIKEYPATKATLLRTRWWPQEDGSWALGLAGRPLVEYFPSKSLGTYKSFYWKDGIVDHEDVIYLSHLILSRFPRLVQFIAARFPYIFVDEFQDTQPAQTELLLKFAAHGTVVGVIGDVEQSIYAFINARPRDFYEIPLQGIVDYAISMNQRSSGEIVRFLNAVRKDDLVQQSVKGENGVAVKVIHGDLKNMVDYVRSQNGAYSPVFLTRTNARVAELRQIDNGHIVREVWDECEECDLLRYRFLRRLLQASEFIRNDQMSYGVKRALEALSFHRSSIGRLFTQQGPVTKLTCQGIAVALLECDLMLDDSVTLFDAYAEYSSVFNRHSIRIPAITRGKFREFAEGISLGNLRSALDTPDAKTEFRTIHSAKGAEFDTVGLFLFENNSLDKCLDPDVINERLRLAYVGMSRAKSHLIVCLAHEPHESLCSKIKALGAQVYEV